tara:strand:- start:444 stop:581 length:138 start_codon:yes stop_codon:yes gene_type:complete
LVFAKIMEIRRKPGNLEGWLEYDAKNRLDQLSRTNQIRKEIYMGL